MMQAYLGIDESNHGKFPEIFVAVYSCSAEDVEVGKLNKNRDKENIFSALGNRKFSYVIVPEEYGLRLTNRQIQIVVYSELISHFGELEKVIIDGELSAASFAEIRQAVHLQALPKIIATSHADITYPIVNLADHIANLLFKHYTRNRSLGNDKYKQCEVTPNLNEFKFLLRHANPEKQTAVNSLPSKAKILGAMIRAENL